MTIELAAALVIPAVGWAFYVERRLATLNGLHARLDRIDEQLSNILDYLLKT